MKRNYIFIIIFSLVLALSWGLSFGDDDDDGEYSFWKRQPGVAPVTNTLYEEECGSCHFAYQPGLLPEPSWNKIMSGLDDHFGDNAELSADAYQKIRAYLMANSADKVKERRSRKILRSVSLASAPLRITETPYIKHEHDEIPGRYISGNDKVASLSNCNACHQKASQGSFSEREINIPGVGRWDD